MADLPPDQVERIKAAGLGWLGPAVPPAVPPAEVQVLRLRPGDALVITFPGLLTMAERARIRERAHEALGPDVPVLILDRGPELAVVRAPDQGDPDADVRDGLPGSGLR